MNPICTKVQSELVGFHFGEVELASRGELEAHLLTCSDCLRDFLAIKREIETAESDIAPSPEFRLGLRAAVAREVRAPERTWTWWERPVAVVTAAVALAVSLFALQTVSEGNGPKPHSIAHPPALTAPAQSDRF